MMEVADIVESIAHKAVARVEGDGSKLAANIRGRAYDAAKSLAMCQLKALAGHDTTESMHVADARFSNIAAAASQGVANSLADAVRQVVVDGLVALSS